MTDCTELYLGNLPFDNNATPKEHECQQHPIKHVNFAVRK